jgi:CubicO group peptidase (beta-lactamase class C family)
MRAQAIATQFSGSVLVARGDEVLFAGGYGYADIERGIRNDVHTQYRIGSVTKPFTAITILQLQESGLLSVTDPVCRYFDPCPPAWSPITLHELLSHTSGIPDLTARQDFLEVAAKPASREEIVATFRDLPLRFPVGEKFEYSNSNYHLLGWIIERVTGEPYGDVLAERTFAPLGLSATFMDGSSAASGRVAVGYRPADDGTLLPDSRYDPAWSFASGGLFSTVEDLYRWNRALEADEILSASSREIMWTPVQDTYGYGWNIREASPETLNRRVRMHSGRTPGYTACFEHFPDDDLTAIVLSNNVMADLCPIVGSLAAIMLGEPYEIPIARRAIRIDHALLDRYTGRYRWSANAAIDITRESDWLVVHVPPSPDRLQLFPESDTDFFLKTMDVQVIFETNRRGESVGLTVRGRGRSAYLERLGE